MPVRSVVVALFAFDKFGAMLQAVASPSIQSSLCPFGNSVRRQTDSWDLTYGKFSILNELFKDPGMWHFLRRPSYDLSNQVEGCGQV